MPSVLGLEVSGFSAAYFAISSCSATGAEAFEPPHPARKTMHGSKTQKRADLVMVLEKS